MVWRRKFFLRIDKKNFSLNNNDYKTNILYQQINDYYKTYEEETKHTFI